MKRRLAFWLSLGVATVLVALLVVPSSRYFLLGLLKSESFEKGHPVSYWIDELNNEDAAMRIEAATTLGSMGPDATLAVPALAQVTRDENPRVRLAAIKSLGKIGPYAGDACRDLIESYQDRKESEDIRKAAVAALGEMKCQDAVPVMIHTLAEDEAFALSGNIQMAVTHMGSAAVPALIQLLQDEDPQCRAHAAVALNWIGPGAMEAVPALIGSLEDDASSVRQGAAFALMRIGPEAKDATPALVKALKDEDPDVARVASMALKQVDFDAKSAEAQP